MGMSQKYRFPNPSGQIGKSFLGIHRIAQRQSVGIKPDLMLQLRKYPTRRHGSYGDFRLVRIAMKQYLDHADQQHERCGLKPAGKDS